jgi:Skp family chaperone for outer membrane proteins
MAGMADHAKQGKAPGLGMAKAAGWTVFLSMAATSATFQVYHSVVSGRMPWELAALYGVVPLLISVCLLEVITHWPTAPFWAPWAAYAIMGGAMLLSAIATGSVVFRAAPPHMSAVFGVLMDGAALLTVHYLINGPREAAEAAARAAAEDAAVARAEADERAALRAELNALRETLETARAGHDERLGAVAAELETARAALVDAREKAEDFAAKLEALRTRNSRAKNRTASQRNKDANSRQSAVPDDIDARAEALAILAGDPDISGAKLGERVGRTARWGQLLKSELATSPRDPMSGS